MSPVCRAILRRPRAVLLLVIGALVLLAWFNRFVQDDAFISFRYAQNLARGLGLVWNPGERVEGYTNFLWTLLMAIPHKLGISPVGFSFGLGLVLFALSLYLTSRVAASVLGSENQALLAVVLLGTNYTFNAFATSGMETQLQACLLVLAVLLLLGIGADSGAALDKAVLLSVVLGLAVLTRPDSALLVALALPLAIRRLRAGRPTCIPGLCALAGPLVVLVGGWLAWKLTYYGNLLPNTFYAKTPDPVSLLRGGYYFLIFIGTYLLFLLVPAAVQASRQLARTPDPKRLTLAALTGLWFAYVFVFGGDFMEFRMLVPVLPFLFTLIVWMLNSAVRSRAWRSALVAVVLAGSLFHGLFHGTGVLTRGPESVRHLAEHLVIAHENWAGIGQLLARSFGPGSGVAIATTAAGAIPYYSGLRTVDMLGLNDAEVARHGRRVGSRPGHRRAASLAYLVCRGVNLVLGHPAMVNSDSTANKVGLDWLIPGYQAGDRIPEDARLVEIPIDRGYRLVALYLVRSGHVERAIAHQGWILRPVPPYSDSLGQD